MPKVAVKKVVKEVVKKVVKEEQKENDMHYFILPYAVGSASAKNLSEALKAPRIKARNSKFLSSDDKIVINWGMVKSPAKVKGSKILNPPEKVRLASDKLLCFQRLSENGVAIVEFTDDRAVAEQWIHDGGSTVCRCVLNGHSGEGIVIADTAAELVDAPLYTKYMPKKSEFRVHVHNGKIIDAQRKARKKEVEDYEVNWRVRNLAGGFIFAREDLELPLAVKKAALEAVSALGLDFGAVDVLWNRRYKKAAVVEVNTAPGLSGSTVDSYAKAFKDFLK